MSFLRAGSGGRQPADHWPSFARNRFQIGAYSAGTLLPAYFFLRSERMTGPVSSSSAAGLKPATASERSGNHTGGDFPLKDRLEPVTGGFRKETSHTRTESGAIQTPPEREI